MKRFLTIILTSAALLTASVTASAQFFNSLSLGIGAGVDGASLQLGVPVGGFFQLRAGASYTPNIGYAFTIPDISFDNGESGDLDLKARLAYKGANAMLDMFPGRHTRFHFTIGVMAGNGKLITVDGTSDALDEQDKGTSGIRIGDTLVTTDENGYCHADIASVRKIMPYFGIGTGRACNQNQAVSFLFDLGVCYSEALGAYTYGTNIRTGQTDYIRVTSDDIDGYDNGIIDIVGRYTPVLPVMKFTLFFKLF